jgi:hypothetical protein
MQDVIEMIDTPDMIDADPNTTLVDPEDDLVHINVIGYPSTLLTKRVRANSTCREIYGYRVVKKRKDEEAEKEIVTPLKV